MDPLGPLQQVPASLIPVRRWLLRRLPSLHGPTYVGQPGQQRLGEEREASDASLTTGLMHATAACAAFTTAIHWRKRLKAVIDVDARARERSAGGEEEHRPKEERDLGHLTRPRPFHRPFCRVRAALQKSLEEHGCSDSRDIHRWIIA